MENETKITIKLPADLLAAVKAKADKKNTTVSALVRKFFLTYVTGEDELVCETSNAIYSYQDIAARKRELKEAVREAHKEFNERQQEYADFFKQNKKESIFVTNARYSWKRAVAEYKAFCEEHK